jgi:hypothetical protein
MKRTNMIGESNYEWRPWPWLTVWLGTFRDWSYLGAAWCCGLRLGRLAIEYRREED